MPSTFIPPPLPLPAVASNAASVPPPPSCLCLHMSIASHDLMVCRIDNYLKAGNLGHPRPSPPSSSPLVVDVSHTGLLPRNVVPLGDRNEARWIVKPLSADIGRFRDSLIYTSLLGLDTRESAARGSWGSTRVIVTIRGLRGQQLPEHGLDVYLDNSSA